MDDTNWKSTFRDTYERGTRAWREGRRSPSSMFDRNDEAFLASIGCTTQELFDFVDDAASDGEPDFETVLAVQEIRRDFFLSELNGQWTGRTVPTDRLPAKAAQADGIAWLPRIIEKARLKLRGEMAPDLMYGCGGDRPFLRSVNMTLPEFLRLVRDRSDDDRAIIEAVKRAAGKSGT